MTYNVLILIFWLVGLICGILNCVDEYRNREFGWFFGFNLVCCVILVIACLLLFAVIVHG